MHSIDAVLPLTLRDVPRFRILHRSMRIFFRDMGTCWVVVPDRECAQIREQIEDPKYRVLAESTIIPELSFYNFVRTVLGRGHAPTQGWYVQQLAKMAIAEAVETDFYLTLDADVICVRPVGYADLIRNGRAVAQATSRDLHPRWYEWAERVLRLRRSHLTHGVTPAVLNRRAMVQLQDYLARRTDGALRLLSHLIPSSSRASQLLVGWRSFLLRNIPWTEYALYGTFLDATSLYHHIYLEPQDEVLYGNCVWTPEAFSSWDPERSFRANAFFFSIVQSNSVPDTKQVWARVAAYLGATDVSEGQSVPRGD